MRVITGTAKGRRLKTAEGREVRPTAEKVKEAMFSMVQFELEGAVVLDLFAGSGQLGIEALSRGAAKAYFADSSAASIALVRENLEHTGLSDRAEVSHMPNTAFLRTAGERFDLAFLDPPYEKGLIARSLPALTERMSEKGVILCEHERGCRLPGEVGGFRIEKTRDHGKTTITVYRRIKEETGYDE